MLTEDITLGSGCVLEFDGGSISGAYTLTGTNTGIQAGLVKIFNTDVTLAGTWNVVEVYPKWFGAKGDGTTDDTLSIQRCIDNAWLAKIPVIQFTPGKYVITSINLTAKSRLTIRGCGKNSGFHRDSFSEGIICEMFVTGTNSVGFDLTNSGGIIIEDLQFRSVNDENIPQTFMLLARSQTNAACTSNIIRNCEFSGYTSKFAIAIIGAELNKFYNNVFNGYFAIACVGNIDVNSVGIIPPFTTIVTSDSSATTNNFHNCDFLNFIKYGEDSADRNAACIYLKDCEANMSIRDSYFKCEGEGNKICHGVIIDFSNAYSGQVQGGLSLENIRQEGAVRRGSLLKVVPPPSALATAVSLVNISIKNCFCGPSVDIPVIDIPVILKTSQIQGIHFFTDPLITIYKKVRILGASTSMIEIPYDGTLITETQYFFYNIFYGDGAIEGNLRQYGDRNLIIGNDFIRMGNGYNTENKLYPASTDKGMYNFDENGKPIFWNGTAWVDATGTPV